MVKETLVSFARDAGWKLLAKLDSENLQITDAFWQYNEEEEAWRLVLATPLVTTEGPIVVYQHILAALNTIPEHEREDLLLSDISVVNSDSNLIAWMRSTYGTVSEGYGQRIRRIHLANNEQFIYRLQ
ncbi:MAG: hypothetical protein OHK0029_29010 [Armatimonadaceae bacterium]